MPSYRILLSKGRDRSVVVIDADSEQAAVEHILSGGASVLAIEEIHVQVADSHAPALPRVQTAIPTRRAGRRGSDWSGFWSFRIMLTPSIIRSSFIVASVCLVSYLALYPLYFFVERSKVGTAEAGVVRQLEAALPRIKSLREQWDNQRAEADRLALQEGYRVAAAEARAKATKSEAALRQALRDAGIAPNQSENEALADARLAHQLARQTAPPIRDLALNLGASVIMWIILRLFCEISIIFFRIHEQVVGMSDRIIDSRGL